MLCQRSGIRPGNEFPGGGQAIVTRSADQAFQAQDEAIPLFRKHCSEERFDLCLKVSVVAF